MCVGGRCAKIREGHTKHSPQSAGRIGIGGRASQSQLRGREGMSGSTRPSSGAGVPPPLRLDGRSPWITGTAEGELDAQPTARRKTRHVFEHETSPTALTTPRGPPPSNAQHGVRVGPFWRRCSWAVDTFMKSNFLAFFLKKKFLSFNHHLNNRTSIVRFLFLQACRPDQGSFRFRLTSGGWG